MEESEPDEQQPVRKGGKEWIVEKNEWHLQTFRLVLPGLTDVTIHTGAGRSASLRHESIVSGGTSPPPKRLEKLTLRCRHSCLGDLLRLSTRMQPSLMAPSCSGILLKQRGAFLVTAVSLELSRGLAQLCWRLAGTKTLAARGCLAIRSSASEALVLRVWGKRARRSASLRHESIVSGGRAPLK